MHAGTTVPFLLFSFQIIRGAFLRFPLCHRPRNPRPPSCNHSGTKAQWPIPTRPTDRSRSLVRCSNAGTSPRLAVGQTPCASPYCHQIANTELLPPFTVTSRCAGTPSVLKTTPVKQCLCLPAAHCTSQARRCNDLYRGRRMISMDISLSVSA